MKRHGPLLKMTLALVVLCGMLVMVADLIFGVLPDRAAQTRDLRKSVVEALSVQVAALLEAGDQRTLQRTLSSVVALDDILLKRALPRWLCRAAARLTTRQGHVPKALAAPLLAFAQRQSEWRESPRRKQLRHAERQLRER